MCSAALGFDADDVQRAADFGLERMRHLSTVQEPQLYKLGMWLEEDNPARYVAAFNSPSDGVQTMARYGYAALQATSKLVFREDKSHGVDQIVLPSVSLLNTDLHDQCPFQEQPLCPTSSSRYRTADGRCNNPAHPWWGAAMTPLHRFLPPQYKDGIEQVRNSVSGVPLPSARAVSTAIHGDRNIELFTITHMVMQWGQFLDHDLTASSQTRGFNGSVPKCCSDGGKDFLPRRFMHPDCLPITVPIDDWFYSHYGVRCMEFVRSSPAPRLGCPLGPRNQINQVTSFIDASNVYGSSRRMAHSLRLYRNGLLKYSRVPYRLPLLPPAHHKADLCREGSLGSLECFHAGDSRVNEQPGLISLHILWLRVHNHLATEFSRLNAHWNDERLYQEARRIVGAMMQHISYREFLPLVLGQDVVKLFGLDLFKHSYYEGYDIKVNPTASNSFGTAAFRFGHSLVQHSLVRCDASHQCLPSNISLHQELTIPSNLYNIGSVDRLLLGLCTQSSQKRDEFITEELTNHLFQTPRFKYGMDLAAINIQRGRDHGLPNYNAWRSPCGLKPFTRWDDLISVMSPETQRRLRRVYRDINDIDLFPGGMAEKPVYGGLVGPTFACILAQQFSNLRKGDRFWYENGGFESSFTPAQLQQIRKVTLARILCDNMDNVGTMQPFVFLKADRDRNPLVSCSSPRIPKLDLSPWIEQYNMKEENEVNTHSESGIYSNVKPIPGSNYNDKVSTSQEEGGESDKYVPDYNHKLTTVPSSEKPSWPSFTTSKPDLIYFVDNYSTNKPHLTKRKNCTRVQQRNNHKEHFIYSSNKSTFEDNLNDNKAKNATNSFHDDDSQHPKHNKSEESQPNKYLALTDYDKGPSVQQDYGIHTNSNKFDSGHLKYSNYDFSKFKHNTSNSGKLTQHDYENFQSKVHSYNNTHSQQADYDKSTLMPNHYNQIQSRSSDLGHFVPHDNDNILSKPHDYEYVHLKFEDPDNIPSNLPENENVHSNSSDQRHMNLHNYDIIKSKIHDFNKSHSIPYDNVPCKLHGCDNITSKYHDYENVHSKPHDYENVHSKPYDYDNVSSKPHDYENVHSKPHEHDPVHSKPHDYDNVHSKPHDHDHVHSKPHDHDHVHSKPHDYDNVHSKPHDHDHVHSKPHDYDNVHSKPHDYDNVHSKPHDYDNNHSKFHDYDHVHSKPYDYDNAHSKPYDYDNVHSKPHDYDNVHSKPQDHVHSKPHDYDNNHSKPHDYDHVHSKPHDYENNHSKPHDYDNVHSKPYDFDNVHSKPYDYDNVHSKPHDYDNVHSKPHDHVHSKPHDYDNNHSKPHYYDHVHSKPHDYDNVHSKPHDYDNNHPKPHDYDNVHSKPHDYDNVHSKPHDYDNVHSEPHDIDKIHSVALVHDNVESKPIDHANVKPHDYGNAHLKPQDYDIIHSRPNDFDGQYLKPYTDSQSTLMPSKPIDFTNRPSFTQSYHSTYDVITDSRKDNDIQGADECFEIEYPTISSVKPKPDDKLPEIFKPNKYPASHSKFSTTKRPNILIKNNTSVFIFLKRNPSVTQPISKSEKMPVLPYTWYMSRFFTKPSYYQISDYETSEERSDAKESIETSKPAAFVEEVTETAGANSMLRYTWSYKNEKDEILDLPDIPVLPPDPQSVQELPKPMNITEEQQTF